MQTIWKYLVASRKRIAIESAAVLGIGAAAILYGCKGADYGGIIQHTIELGQATQIPKSEEPELGQTVAVEATNQFHLHPDPTGKIDQYVTLVGLTVASCSKDPSYPYVFGILESDDVNAISGPGGYIMITWGALRRMQDESELAGVLGHEITHVCNGDGLEAFKKANEAKAEVGIASSATAGQRGSSQFISTFGANVVLTAMNEQFNQKQEFNADKGSIDTIAKAGYDPHGFLRFLQRMEALQQGGAGGIMSSHPGLPDRVRTVEEEIDKLGPAAKGATLAARFTQWTGISNAPTPSPVGMIPQNAAPKD